MPQLKRDINVAADKYENGMRGMMRDVSDRLVSHFRFFGKLTGILYPRAKDGAGDISAIIDQRRSIHECCEVLIEDGSFEQQLARVRQESVTECRRYPGYVECSTILKEDHVNETDG